LTLDLEKQPSSKVITLVGLNESGKTSILQALNLLRNDLPEEERHKLIPKKRKLNFSGSVSVQGFLSVTKEDNEILQNKVKDFGITSIKPINEIKIERNYKFKDSQFIESKNYWTLKLEIQKTPTDKFVE